MSASSVWLGDSVDAAEAPRRLPRGTALIAFVLVTCLALLFVSGDPLGAAGPIFLVAVGYGLLKAPLRVPLYLVTAGVILADIGQMAPDGPGTYRIWTPPTWILNLLLVDNLKKLTHVEALRFSGMELVLAFFAVYAIMRAASGQRVDRSAGPSANATPMVVALAVGLFAVVALEVRGVARGGDVKQSLWQFRYLFWMPVMAGVFMYALRSMQHYREFLFVLTGTSFLKVLVGAYYYFVVTNPAAFRVPSVTSHADTVLWVITLAVWIAAAYERPTQRRIVGAVVVGAVLMLGFVLNNRRTAYVSLGLTMFLLAVLMPARTKRKLIRVGLLMSPLFAVYIAIGTRKTTGIFAPAASIVSVFNQTDRSSETRDIENFNLVTTLKQNKILGSGWGHEYIELVKADDISSIFPQYRLIAHNSMLWMWSIGGLVFFTMLWINVGVAAFLARRVHYFARTPDERVVAYATLAMIGAYLVQTWSDMGVISWTSMSMLAATYAMTAQLAVATGAWPSRVRLWGNGYLPTVVPAAAEGGTPDRPGAAA